MQEMSNQKLFQCVGEIFWCLCNHTHMVNPVDRSVRCCGWDCNFHRHHRESQIGEVLFQNSVQVVYAVNGDIEVMHRGVDIECLAVATLQRRQEFSELWMQRANWLRVTPA